MKNELVITIEKKTKNSSEEEISPIQPKALKFSDAAEGIEYDFLNNSIQSNEYIYNPNKSQASLKINSVDKCETGSNYTVSNAPNVSCLRHGRVFLGIDMTKFKLICKKCTELNMKSELNIDSHNVSMDSSTDVQQEEIQCTVHADQPAILYCDDCKTFICQDCCNSCKNHNCNLPSFIPNILKFKIREIFDNLRSYRSKLEENLDLMIKTGMKLNTFRENLNKVYKDKLNSIIETFKRKLEQLQNTFENIFDNYDKEIENVLTRIFALQKRVNKYISEVKLFLTKLDEVKISHNDNETISLLTVHQSQKINSMSCFNYKILEQRKDKFQLFKEIKKTLLESENFLCYKIPTIKKEFNLNLEKWKKKITLFNKNVELLESSVKSAILSGCKTHSISLKRFPKFSRKGMRYYKTSSVIMEVNKDVFISGLGLCGLYITSFKTSDLNSTIYKDIDEKGKIPIDISISQLSQNDRRQTELKLFECSYLYGIVNRLDPIFLIYFKKAVLIQKETKYLITVKNNDTNSLIDLWTGEVNNAAKNNMSQSIQCNVSKVHFTFSPAEGVESDFNEFSLGIISNLLYQTSD